jgi:short-subunit dehydrogenase
VYSRLSELFKTELVDILFNNGGISMREEFSKMELSTCETIMNTNMLSHIAATKAALSGMKQRKFG